MSDEKQVNAIRIFCARPTKTHSKRQTGAPLQQDWAYLVNQVYYFDHGKALKDADVTILNAVAKSAQRKFPNDSNWDRVVSAPGAHERILSHIREGLQAELNRPQVTSPDSQLPNSPLTAGANQSQLE